MIKAAIIDDSVDNSQFDSLNSWIISENMKVQKANDFIVNKNSHATICLKIIEKYSDMSNVIWHSIKILDDKSKTGNINKFLKALKFCEQINVKLIHLSIGSRAHEDFKLIEKYINCLFNKGIIVIAAISNEGVITYPACMQNVIGVKNNNDLKDGQYIFIDNPIDNINFSASGRHILRWNSEIIVTKPSNSYAAPVITAKVISMLKRDCSALFGYIYIYIFA